MRITEYQTFNLLRKIIIAIISVIIIVCVIEFFAHEQKQVDAAKKIIQCHDQKVIYDFIKTDQRFTDVDRQNFLNNQIDNCYQKIGVKIPKNFRRYIDDPDKFDKKMDEYAISRIGVVRK